MALVSPHYELSSIRLLALPRDGHGMVSNPTLKSNPKTAKPPLAPGYNTVVISDDDGPPPS